MLQGVHVEQLALGRLERGVADHAGGSAHEGKGLVARPLKVHEHHDLHEVAHAERIRGGVKADVGLLRAGIQKFFSARHAVVQHAPPAEFFYKRSHAAKLGRPRRRATFGT